MRDILKAGSKVAFATLVGLLGSVVTGKVLSLELGAAGLGLYGMLRQLLQNLTLIGSFNGQNALVQGIAHHSDNRLQVRFSGSVLSIQIIISGALAMILLIGAPWLGPLLIPHSQSVGLLRWLSLAMLVLVANAYVLGLLNGHRLINQLVKFQLLGPIATLVLLYPSIMLIRAGQTFGYLLMLVGASLLITLVAARAVYRSGYFPSLSDLSISKADGVQFLRMSSVLTMAGIIATAVQFSQSWLVARWMGLAQTGQFWAAWTLSMTYVSLVLGSLGTYYLPSLSRLVDPAERRELIRKYFLLVLLFMPLLVSLVVVFKPIFIELMFSSTMLPALKVMRWMLIGDFFKAVSYVLSYPMLAFNDMKWFFWTDIIFSLGIGVASFVWVFFGGDIEGLGMIFMIVYILFLVVSVIYIRIKHAVVFNIEEFGRFFLGLALVLILSLYTWKSEHVSWGDVSTLVLLCGVFVIISIRGINWYSMQSLWKRNTEL